MELCWDETNLQRIADIFISLSIFEVTTVNLFITSGYSSRRARAKVNTSFSSARDACIDGSGLWSLQWEQSFFTRILAWVKRHIKRVILTGVHSSLGGVPVFGPDCFHGSSIPRNPHRYAIQSASSKFLPCIDYSTPGNSDIYIHESPLVDLYSGSR